MHSMEGRGPVPISAVRTVGEVAVFQPGRSGNGGGSPATSWRQERGAAVSERVSGGFVDAKGLAGADFHVALRRCWLSRK